jgi:NADH:ubiquinone oxidoreductase subunit 6 (subunit J)
MRLLTWVLEKKTRITLAVAALSAFEFLLLFGSSRSAFEHWEASVPFFGVIVGPFLIVLAVSVLVWARKDTRRKSIENVAFGMTLIWLVSYAFILFAAVHRPR